MEEKIVEYDEYLTALEELGVQYDLIIEDLGLPESFFDFDAPTFMGRIDPEKTKDFPISVIFLNQDDSKIMNYGLKAIKGMLLAYELAKQFKYNGYRVKGGPTKDMPLREYKPVVIADLGTALKEWDEKLEDLLAEYFFDVGEYGEACMSFELRTRARSIGTEYYNIFLHVNFDHPAVTISNMEDIAKAYMEALELLKKFPYNNFKLVKKDGSEDFNDYGSWLNREHL